MPKSKARPCGGRQPGRHTRLPTRRKSYLPKHKRPTGIDIGTTLKKEISGPNCFAKATNTTANHHGHHITITPLDPPPPKPDNPALSTPHLRLPPRHVLRLRGRLGLQQNGRLLYGLRRRLPALCCSRRFCPKTEGATGGGRKEVS